MLVADCHTDLLLELHHRRHRLGERDAFAATWKPLLDAGGVRLQVCPIFVELDRQPESTLREALGEAAAFHAAASETPGVAAVRTRRDLDAVERGDVLGLVLALEGVEPLGYDVHTADVFWELGMRMASLTWNRRNPFADGAAETGGLSLLGRRLVRRLVTLGVVLDLAHASPATFDAVLGELDGAPVAVSHAACRAVNDHPRNLSDEQLHALAAAGGFLGIMLHPLAIGHERPTIVRACEHIEHAASVMGVDRVGLGGDFVARLTRVLPPMPVTADGLMPPGLAHGSAIDGLAGPEDYPALAAALVDRGWTQDDVARVMGVNLLAFLRSALPR